MIEKRSPIQMDDPKIPDRQTEDDCLEAELGQEIQRISTAIDTILKKVDALDPVFRNQDGAAAAATPAEGAKESDRPSGSRQPPAGV
jgi:hypothetical protein